MKPSFSLLLAQSRAALGLTQSGLADAVGGSLRTIQRMEASRSPPKWSHCQTLAPLVFPHDPELADSLARAAGTTLEALGVLPQPAPAAPVAPSAPPAAPPPPAAPTTPPVPIKHVIDSVVCAAAEAIDVTPRAVRPALHAALVRAQSLGLSLESMEKALRPAAPPRPARNAAAARQASRSKA